MTGEALLSLAPLAMLGLGALVAMVMAPVAEAGTIRATTAALFVAAFLVVVLRLDAPEAVASPLLADDGLARYGAALSILAGLGVLGFARPIGLAREGPALVAIATAGAVALAAASSAATIFVGLEIMTLALVALAIMPRSPEALEAGYKLFLLAGAGAAALLFGIALGLAGSGGVALDAWSGGTPVAAFGAALLLAGLAVKFGLVPFHMWVPDLFSGSPAAAAALAASLSKVAVGAVLLRLTWDPPGGMLWAIGLAVAGTGAVLLGNIAALGQTQLLRMLGYSSIAHSGYIALALASGATITSKAVMIYLSAYAPAAVAALCVAALLAPTVERPDLRGLLWRRPLAGAALALALLSMAGLPPTMGFIGKVYLFSALAEAEAYALLAIVVTGSAIAFYYYIRFSVQLAMPATEETAIADTRLADRVALAVAIALIVVPGMYPEPLMAIAETVGP